MNIIIFSKDRAMQLDLLLRSITQFYPYGTVSVLYAASNEQYEQGYNLIKERHNVNLIWQRPFKKRLIKTIEQGDEIITMLVDDSVFIKPVKKEPLDIMTFDLIVDKNLKCGSLMLGKNIKYSYSHSCTIEQPKFIIDDNYYWNWTKQPMKSDWGYPHQVGGNVWTKDYLLKILKWKRFEHPTELEGKLNYPYRKRKTSTPLMTCFDETKLLTIPVNYIEKSTAENRNSQKYSLERLNNLYLKNYQISTENIYGTETDAICKEIDFEFELRED